MSNQKSVYTGLLLASVGLLGLTVLDGDLSPTEKTQAVSVSRRQASQNLQADKRQVHGSQSFVAVSSFEKWRSNYRIASVGERSALENNGVTLAKARLREMVALARVNPVRARGLLFSLADLASLPPVVRAACEQPISSMGSIDLRWSTQIGKDEYLSCQHRNIAFVGNQSWKVNGADFQEARPPRSNVPLDGYVIDGELLISDSAVRQLDAVNLAAATAIYPMGNANQIDPVTGNPVDSKIAALIGGKVYRFENQTVMDRVIVRLRDSDREATVAKIYQPDTGFQWLEVDGGTGVENDDPPVQPTPYLSDNINVLFIRVDFSDIPGAPVSQADLQTSLATTHGHLQNYSYGAATLNSTVTSQLYRMPNPSTTYTNDSNGSDALLTAARSLAAANYTLGNYDVVGVYFPSLSGADFNYGGLASVGGGDHWINGLTSSSSRVSVLLHEFGHNYGLFHSNYWDPMQQIVGSYSGPGNASLEYGDIFDRMGSAGSAEGYFGPFSTRRLNWMPSGKVVQPTANGTWRIHRFDSPSALSEAHLALRVPMGGNEYWWIGHRKLFAGISNSAYVVAEGLYAQRPNLIDMTPNSLSPESSDRSDAGLPVGSEYYSSGSGVRIRTTASGGVSPNEWIDVEVEFDSRVEIVTTDVEVDEQVGSAVLNLRRSFGSTGVLTVNYATGNGSAIAGSDYLATQGTVTWGNGDSADKTVLIPIRPDLINDGGETLNVALSGAVGGTLVTSQSTATITILDPGQRFTSFDADYFNTTVNAIAPLDDGKVVIGGNFTVGIAGNFARLNANGTEDPSFLKGTGFNGAVSVIVRQNDGKFLVGGEFTSYGGTPCNRLVRLHADGTVDSAFVSAMGNAANAAVNAITIEASGKILVGGLFNTFSGASVEGLVRLTAVGARDTANPLSLPFDTGWNTRILAILTQEDGKIMAVGSFYAAPVASNFRSGVIRLNADGTRDTSFDAGAGLHVFGTTSSLQTGNDIILQPDGKYIIGGNFSAYDENAVSNLVRITSGGAYDSSFTPPLFSDTIHSLLLEKSGNIVVGGSFVAPANRLERLFNNGAVDPRFQQGTGTGGRVEALARGGDGALWVGGNFYSYNGVSIWPVVKVAGGIPAYELWMGENFTSAQIFGNLSDPEDDPDGDGISNIAEMALGSSPNVANDGSTFTPLSGSTAVISSALQASVARGGSTPGVWMAAQFSSDLIQWSPTNPLPGSNATYEIVEDGATRFTVRDKTTGAPKRFVRFVARNPE